MMPAATRMTPSTRQNTWAPSISRPPTRAVLVAMNPSFSGITGMTAAGQRDDLCFPTTPCGLFCYTMTPKLVRPRLLRHLAERGPAGLEELADAADVHPNTARAHVHELEREGLVVREETPSGGRGR